MSMPGFDPTAYEEAVIKPLRRRRGHLPDLVTRYAVEPTMTESALAERVNAVVQLWNKRGRRGTSDGQVYRQLLREHDTLKADGKDLGTQAFWTAYQAERTRQLGAEITELADQLTASHGELGVITRSQLRAAAAAHSLSDAELDQACAAARLQLVEPLELPAEPGMPGRYKGLEDKLLAAGVSSIPELLFPGLAEWGLVGGFSVRPAPAGRTVELSQVAAEEQAQNLAKAADSPAVRAATDAVGQLTTAAKAGADLGKLALYHLLQDVRASRAEGAGARPLFAMLVAKKLRKPDAAVVAVSVLAEATTQRDPAAEVAEMLAEGRLIAAKQLAATLPVPGGDALRESVRLQGEQVETLRAEARADVLARREEQAAARLREALALGSDVPGLADELAKLPAAPATGVTASPDGRGVRVAWAPATSHDENTSYCVVRGAGRVPVDVTDGQDVPAGPAAATDATPPVGTPLHYAVFARSGSGRWSRPATATVQVVPPVTDLAVEGGEGVVTGHWSVHPDAVTVEVRRTIGSGDGPGEPVAVDRCRVFRDEDVADGTVYLYSVVACYRSPAGGAVLRSTPVVRRGTPRTEAKPLSMLRARPVPGEELTVELSWRQAPAADVVIRRSARPCPWDYGAFVTAAQLDGYGTELDGRPAVNGEKRTLRAAAPSGRSVFVPFTLGNGGGVRGQDAVVDLIAPLKGVQAQRFGDDVRLSWVWPDGVHAADVRWSGGHRRITVQQMRDEGGCNLRGVPAVRRVDVSAVILGPGEDESSSPPTVVDVDGRPPELRYELRRRGCHLFGGVTATVTVTGTPVAGAELIVVAAAGAVMPRTPDAGMELARCPIVIRPDVPTVVEAAVPRLRKPYWLRCFLAEPAPALLVDPPVSQLKVS